ncbi:hypothetical protein Scep_000292 [Stephania cephalantha]|uniref:GDSL esterase/lipase EXL3 n=1 Tax=Stephania cephalantha TaxID=152367 RepID=A0AAP0Q6J0_9MAGN
MSFVLSIFVVLIVYVERLQGYQVMLPPNITVPALFAFGDSIVDTGNNNHLATVIKCNFPPYGRDFQGGLPTGRFCNGKTPADFIAQSLGIKELLPAYLDPNLKPADLLTGVCFASGAAGYDPLTAKVVNVLGLSVQINMFKEYIWRLKAMVGEERSASILSNSLYVVVAGSDDIANTYLGTPFRKFKYDIPAYTDLMVRGASSFIQELYDLGARRIGVFSAPPLGCLPSQRTLRGGKQRKCVDGPNQAALLFNSELSAAIARFNRKYSEARAVYIDTYTSLLQIINNPHSYGFEEVSKGCCGTGKIEVVILCNKLSPGGTCPDPSKYVFWDSFHPTEKTYQILVDELLKKYAYKFFEANTAIAIYNN